MPRERFGGVGLFHEAEAQLRPAETAKVDDLSQPASASLPRVITLGHATPLRKEIGDVGKQDERDHQSTLAKPDASPDRFRDLTKIHS